MPRVNPIVGQGLAACVALFRVGGDDEATVSASSYDGDVERLAPGILCFRRSDDSVFVIHRIGRALVSGTRYVLAVVYTLALTRDDINAFTALANDLDVDIVRRANGTRCVWRTVLHADGTLRVPALDSDATTIGNAVKANLWPASWRVRLVTDAEGAQPTGARFLAEVLA